MIRPRPGVPGLAGNKVPVAPTSLAFTVSLLGGIVLPRVPPDDNSLDNRVEDSRRQPARRAKCVRRSSVERAKRA